MFSAGSSAADNSPQKIRASPTLPPPAHAGRLVKTAAKKKSAPAKQTAPEPAAEEPAQPEDSAPPPALNPHTGSTLPGGISESLKTAPAPKHPKPVIEKRAPKKTKATASGGGPEMHTTLKRIEFKGNTVFSSEELSALVSDYLTRPVTLTEIYEAADKISDHYVLAGYSLAVVTIPAQKIAKGKITFQVFEGVIGKIAVEDNTVYSTDQILDYLDDLKHGEIYRAAPLEEALQALNSLPGLQTKAVIKPGEDPGASDLLVKVQEKRVGGTLSVDNFGRNNTGALRVTAAAQLNNLLHLADQFQLITLRSGTAGLRYSSGGYSLKPWVHGPRIGLSYGEATFKISGAPVDGLSRNGRFNLDFSLLNTRTEKFNLGAGATRIISSVNLAGFPQPVTSITTYDLSGSYNRVGESGEVTAVVLSLASNFKTNTVADCTGAGNPACRDQLLKVDFGVQHLQPILPRLDALIRLAAAYSPQALPDSQQFSAGGPGNVRGFRSAEIRGDLGYTSSVDLRYGVPLFDEANSTLRVFADAAQIGTQDSVARNTLAQESIADVGVGLDFAYTEHFNLRADWAFPVSPGYVAADGTRTRDSRVYASASLSY